MNTEYTAIVKQSGDWWIGWIKEIPGVNCQERTHEKLIESLKITLKEALERIDYKKELKHLLMRSLVKSHTTSLYVMPEVLNRASSVFLDSPEN